MVTMVLSVFLLLTRRWVPPPAKISFSTRFRNEWMSKIVPWSSPCHWIMAEPSVPASETNPENRMVLVTL